MGGGCRGAGKRGRDRSRVPDRCHTGRDRLDIRIWMLPNHMRPSHSIKGLRKGNFEKPRSFRDRLYLTDVGDALWQAARAPGGEPRFRLRSHKNYLLTGAEIEGGGIRAVIEGHKMGRSTWTAAFIVQVSGSDQAVRAFLEKVLGILGRVPVTSPYWTSGEWEAVRASHSVDREGMLRPWRAALPNRRWAPV